MCGQGPLWTQVDAKYHTSLSKKPLGVIVTSSKHSLTHTHTCNAVLVCFQLRRYNCVAAPRVLQRLDEALESALRSDLEDVTLALIMAPAHFDAYLLRKATKVNNFLYFQNAKCDVTVHFTVWNCSGFFCSLFFFSFFLSVFLNLQVFFI